MDLRGDSAPRASAIPQVARISGTPEASRAPAVSVRLQNPAGELGYFGPLGSNGPLGVGGAVGEKNPSHFITGSIGWDGWAKVMNAFGGPLSALGPLGANGPLNTSTASSVPEALKVGGSEAALGPSGPLGALGALGPLGPVGAHGYKADKDGEYHSADGQVVRTIDVKWNLTRVNREELVEDYSETRAKTLPDNDTSFMVEGTIATTNEADDFKFKSRTDQYVTVLVLPTQGPLNPSDKSKLFDDFELQVFDDSGKQLGASRLANGPDWIQLKVPAGANLTARVTLKGSEHGDAKGYRLAVVGTGDHTRDMTPGKAWDTGGATVIAQPP